GPTAKGKQVDYKALASQGIEIVLEISVTRFGFDSAGGKDPDVALFMVVHARRVDALTGKELWNGHYVYLSRYAPLPVWAQGELARVKSEYTRAYRALGERIVEDVFLHTAALPVEGMAAASSEPRVGCSVQAGETEVADATVDSLQPTLRWKAFDFPGD